MSSPLSHFTPAETMVLLKQIYDYQTPIRYTMLDLCLKNVLKVETYWQKPTKESVVKIKYIVAKTGSAFFNYKPKLHEEGLLDFFTEKPNAYYVVAHIVKHAYHDAKSPAEYIYDDLFGSRSMKNYVSYNLFQRFFGNYSLNHKGKKLNQSISNYIDDLNERLLDLNHDNKLLFLTTLDEIKGNIFLLPDISIESFKIVQKLCLEDAKPIYNSKNELIWDSSINYYDIIKTVDSAFTTGWISADPPRSKDDYIETNYI